MNKLIYNFVPALLKTKLMPRRSIFTLCGDKPQSFGEIKLCFLINYKK